MLIDQILWRQRASRAEKTAVVCGARRFTYAQTAERTLRFANALRGLGIEPGQRVAVLSSNCAEHIEAVYAIAAIGAVWVPLNFRLTPVELAYIADDCEASAVIYSADLAQSAAGLRDLAKHPRLWIGIGEATTASVHGYDDLLLKSAATEMAPSVGGGDLFSIMYTSGTTGRPKGVMLPHDRFFLGTVLSTIGLKVSENDVKLQAIPQFHAGGFIYQLAHMAAGATIVVLPKFETGATLDLIEAEGITAAGFVPSMLLALLEDPRFAKTDFSRVERVMYGGSPIPEDRLARAVETMGAKFLQTYGQTEAGVLVTILDDQDHLRGLKESPEILRSCGRAMVGYEVAVLGDDGQPTDDVGELAVRSGSLMTGYWRRPAESAETLVDGWLRTGDLARKDAEERFYLVDRKKDLIVSGGENVYPIEVEHVLSSHPAVLDVAVVGVPDDRWGEAVKAVVVLRPAARIEQAGLLDFCRGKLGGFKIPKSVDFAEMLPRNASGKIQKNLLRERYWAGRSRKI
ncbi:MAG: long-chain-fatty-acid--CoA ligase [Xanthobacteraceae bacterium]